MAVEEELLFLQAGMTKVHNFQVNSSVERTLKRKKVLPEVAVDWVLVHKDYCEAATPMMRTVEEERIPLEALMALEAPVQVEQSARYSQEDGSLKEMYFLPN